MSTAVVVGAGAMGAAAARVLAERGWGVTLLEQHAIGHDLGGSGHETRSFRLSHSDADDVRLAVRALELWNDLERRGGETLLRRNGLLQRGSVVPPMAAALREAGVRYDELDHRDVSRLFPEMRPQPDAPAIFQRDGAVILARRSILVQVRLACAAGAVVHAGEKCVALASQGDGVRAFTVGQRRGLKVAAGAPLYVVRLEAVRALGEQIKRLVYTSSAAVFGTPSDYPTGPLAEDALAIVEPTPFWALSLPNAYRAGFPAHVLLERGKIDEAEAIVGAVSVEELLPGHRIQTLHGRGRVRLAIGAPEQALADFIAAGDWKSNQIWWW
jgi:hypothetical protein